MPASKKIDTIPLIPSNMGNSRAVTVIRYGAPATGKKVYCQAGLHADEAPGLAVMVYLEAMLDAADAAGEVDGEIVLVPVANPIGISQWRDDMLQGRFNFFDSINFNRRHLDLSSRVAEKVAGKLGENSEQNISTVRSAIGEVLQASSCRDEAEHLKYLLLTLAYDADVVLDLHCDNQALLHVYMGTPLWPEAADLSAQMGAAATLLASDSGVTPFDEACSRIWWTLSKKFPDHPIPPACIAATIELRGISDVTADTATQDAANLFHFLKRRGFIKGEAPPLPPLANAATPLRGVAYIRAGIPGVVIFSKDPGDRVMAGEAIAEIVNPLCRDDKAGRQTVTSQTDGLLFARIHDRFARPGRVIAKVAGKTPLTEKGENLLTL